MKKTKKPIKDLKLKNHGIHTHRLKDNPREAKALLAFQALNERTAGPVDQRDVIDHLVHAHLVEAIATTQQRREVCTVIQWLGSPVGFAWLVDTFGLEVVREMRERHGGSEIKPGQVYRSRDARDKKKGRTVTVERLRYDTGHVLYRRGPSTPWACRSSTSGRISYIAECRLLDSTSWELVK